MRADAVFDPVGAALDHAHPAVIDAERVGADLRDDGLEALAERRAAGDDLDRAGGLDRDPHAVARAQPALLDKHREAGADQILVTGLAVDGRKPEVARKFGAHHTIDVENEDAKQRVRELTDGVGVNIVVDVSSYATEPVAAALDFVRPGGTIVLAGVKGFKPIPEFVSDKIVLKEITIRGAIGVTSTGYRSAIRLLESGKYPFEAMHTHDFGLRDAELAIQTLARQIPGEESIHSCLIPGRD